MPRREVLQVKARFNGCFCDSLSVSSLFKGVTEVLTDCRSSQDTSGQVLQVILIDCAVHHLVVASDTDVVSRLRLQIVKCAVVQSRFPES